MQLSIRKTLLVGLPIAVIAVALFMSSIGSQKAHAAVDPNVDLSLSAPGCETEGVAKCSVNANGSVNVYFNVVSEVAGGWAGYDLKVAFSGNINYQTGSLIQTAAGDPALTGLNCGFPTGELLTGTPKAAPDDDELGNGTMATACASSDGNDHSYTGPAARFTIVCKDSGSGTVSLQHGDGVTDLVNSTFSSHSEAAAPATEDLTINCVPAPTATPIPPTPTPPPNPRMQKDCDKAEAGVQALCNMFLTRQGPKVPPDLCENGDAIVLNEEINIPITSPDPKNPSIFQALAAFEFEIRFDPSLVCIDITADGGIFDPDGICDSLVSEGLIRFGCVTAGKGYGLDGPGILAMINVHPQPEVYSLLRPNQDNGIPVQILNQSCELSDEQGHPISIFSCEDADITFRYLEGDVDGPDCDVDVLDAQQVAFRWGAQIGTTLYTTFMDLEPSGQVKGDGDIDIKDLQFVFGRLGSSCTAPHPPQPPVNPKA